LSGSDLMLTEGGIATKISGVDVVVSNLIFVKNGNSPGKPTVSISFTLTSKIMRTKGADTKSFQATFGLR